MNTWTTTIPGLEAVRTLADDRDAALTDALDHYGLHFAPDGTTVEPAATEA